MNVTVVTRHLGTALLALALARGASAQTAIPDDVRASLRARIAARYLVGVVVGVVDSAGARYAAEGTTAINGGQPVNEHSMYEIGSVTKKWAGLGKELFTSADNYVISLSDLSGVNPEASALLLAAGLSIDIVFKEGK